MRQPAPGRDAGRSRCAAAPAAAPAGGVSGTDSYLWCLSAAASLLRRCRRQQGQALRRLGLSRPTGPGFGDPSARLLIVGLAPAAHGANRTGRLFTGDRSGDFLFAGLYRVGLASQAESAGRSDGLVPNGSLSASLVAVRRRQNRPSPPSWIVAWHSAAELQLCPRCAVIASVGWLMPRWGRPRLTSDDRLPMRQSTHFPGRVLLDCYHVSQQNTFTGRLTPAMLDVVLPAARLAGLSSAPARRLRFLAVGRDSAIDNFRSGARCARQACDRA